MAVPTALPVTMPPDVIEAMPDALLLQAPPVVASVRPEVPPKHTVTGTGAIGAGVALTEIVAVAGQAPIVYDIVAVPAVRPVTTPPETLATAGALLLHMPPEVASVNVTVPPVQTVAPAGDIAAGAALTVATVITEQPEIE